MISHLIPISFSSSDIVRTDPRMLTAALEDVYSPKYLRFGFKQESAALENGQDHFDLITFPGFPQRLDIISAHHLAARA